MSTTIERNSKKIICFDIDGTICTQRKGDYENAQPLEKALEVVNRLYQEGFYIIFFTARFMGRFEQDTTKVYQHGYEMTLRQLKSWGFQFHELHLGKPSHHILVDDKALFFNHDWDVIYRGIKERAKEEIY